MRIRLQSFLSRSAAILQDFLRDTAENVVRAVAGWAKSVATLYAFGAALILVALVALANGLAWAVIELGFPAYAAWLILAGVTGGIGYALFKVGSRKGITPGDREERPGLTIRVEKLPGRRRRPVGLSKRSFRTKGRAVSAARRAARSSSGRVVIHRNH